MSKEIIDLVQSFDHNYPDFDDGVAPRIDVPAEFVDHIGGICGDLDLEVDGPSIGEILYRLFDWMGTNTSLTANASNTRLSLSPLKNNCVSNNEQYISVENARGGSALASRS